MTQRPIMDAGPGINFFSLHKERLLFSAVGALAIPEAVRTEMIRKSNREQRFAAVEGMLRKIPEKYLEIIPDEVTDELAAAVHRIAGRPFSERVRSGKDLGETMVVAHAVVAAERGAQVMVLIDDHGGRQIAAHEAARLQRLKQVVPETGGISLISTVSILKATAGTQFIPDKGSMRELYTRLRGLDDGLLPIARTDLLDPPTWEPRSR